MLGYARAHARGGYSPGRRGRPVVPADHLGVPAPGTALGGLGFLDILFNMWALVVVGPSLEQLLGRVRFVAVYLLSAVGGGGAVLTTWQPHVLALGAHRRDLRPVRRLVRGREEAAPRRPRHRHDHRDQPGVQPLLPVTIAWQDHVGGLIVGVVTTAAFAYAPRKNRTAIQVGAAVAILVVLVVLVVLRSHQLTSQLGSNAGGRRRLVPPGGEDHAGDDQREAADQVPAAERRGAPGMFAAVT